MSRIPDDVRALVMGRGNGFCEVCGVKRASDFHHRQRRREGGHSPQNGLACCRPCHGKVHAQPTWARKHGWIVPTWEDPLTVPMDRFGERVFVLEDGTFSPCPA